MAFAAFRHRKAEKKSFPELYAESSRGFRKIAVFTNFFLSCTFGAKSTKSLRTTFSAGACDPRRCTGRARSSLCATPWRTRRCPPPLFPRQTRVRIYCAANGGIIIYMAMRFGCPFQLTFPVRLRLRATFVSQNQPPSQLHFSFSARRSPPWFRWRKSGRRAESESGGDGLLANPRSRPTPLSVLRSPTAESVGWLLLLFATEKQGKKFFQTFFPEAEKGRREAFCCFSPPKSREKRKSFSGVFLQRTKGHRAASRHLYKKKQSTKNTTLQQGSYTFDLPRKQPPSSP